MTKLPEPFRRPRGRPKGWGDTSPKTFEQFVADSLSKGITPPKPAERPPVKPRGPMAKMTPEQRSEFAKRMRSKVRPETPAARYLGREQLRELLQRWDADEIDPLEI